jgi:hypothetical protein
MKLALILLLTAVAAASIGAVIGYLLRHDKDDDFD